MKLACARLHLVSLLLLLAAVVGLVSPSQARAQNVNSFYSTVAWTVTYVSGQTVLTPIPNATVQVCGYPANAVPCTNFATLYLGPTILGGTGPNPISTDAYGNLSFWAAAGYYQYTLTNSLGQSVGPYTVVLGGSGGGGGGGALFPNTNGIVYNTSTTTAQNATSQQLVTALNNAPSTLLTTLLLPVATTVSLGTVQPDGTTIIISSGGVISSTSSGAVIPATTLLLKGTGTTAISTAASPGTDYVVPSGSITGTAANLSGTPTLPNGTAAVTQATGPCDSSTRIATDAFVITCGSGGGGGGSFSALTPGTNTNGPMVVGTGSSLSTTGSGTINATLVNANSFPGSGALVSGGVLYASSASTVASSGVFAAHAPVVGGGTGAAPATIASTGTSGQALLSGGSSANPAYGLLAYTALVGESSNSVLGNSTGAVAAPTSLSVPSCSGSTNALIWTSGSGFGCNTITTSSASIVASEESVGFSATPTFSTSYRESTITLTGNITSFTLVAGAAGQEKTLTFCQNSSGGFTVTPPSNVHGFMGVGTVASKCNSQHYTYNSIQTAWIADSAGVQNE